ncbi:MAG: hypothetical protein M1838_000739 [Thelocarpon superellum]|nr:MAG: hypothetical protein M1838_000739 [Thelocarpon superellum]
MLSTPQWSVRSLLPPSGPATHATQDSPAITPAKLHHLLRLSALPPPASAEQEESMLATLRSQLHFVRDVQSVDTAGVEPLRGIADETPEAEREAEQATLEELETLVQAEEAVGVNRRRIRKKLKTKMEAGGDAKGGDEPWDPLALPSKKVGRYFVVHRGKESTQDS